MTGAQLGYLGVIVAIVVGLAGVYYAAKQASIAQRAAQQTLIDKAAADAKAPLVDEMRELRLQLRDRDLTIRERDRRIDQLEDELRRGRGHGDDNSLRQPH